MLLAGAGCEGEEPYVAPTPTVLTDPTDAIDPSAAATTLATLERTLEGGDPAAAALGADENVARQLSALAAEVPTLGLTDLSFRYLSEIGAVDSGATTWTADVDVGWRFRGFDDADSSTEVAVAFADDGATIAGFSAVPDGVLPLWLAGPVHARRTDDVLVIDASGDASRIVDRAQEALVVARRVLGDRADDVVVEMPASVAGLHSALGAEEGTYDHVAAITTAPDGSNTPDGPVHVFLNPVVFNALDSVAAQVVMSHEVVHAVTDAPAAQGAPLWLLEGFADYVALRDVDLPVERTAGQVTERVQEDGVPDELPRSTDFAPSNAHLGASYEAAWLVCVTLAERGGEEALVSFYDAVLAGADVEDALSEAFGWTVDDLTHAWQDRLTRLAEDQKDP